MTQHTHLLHDRQRYGPSRPDAARKGAQASPWRFGNMRTFGSLRLREKWNREGTRRK